MCMQQHSAHYLHILTGKQVTKSFVRYASDCKNIRVWDSRQIVIPRIRVRV